MVWACGEKTRALCRTEGDRNRKAMYEKEMKSEEQVAGHCESRSSSREEVHNRAT